MMDYAYLLSMYNEFRRIYRTIKARPGGCLILSFMLFATIGVLSFASYLYQCFIGLESLSFHQRVINKETEAYRNFEDICYAGYCGPWIEEYFMHVFFSNRIQLTDRLYLPISWTNCHLKCSKGELDRLRQYIKNLDTSKKYFTVLQIDKGLQHPSLDIWLHDQLDLIIFSAGGTTRGEKIKNIYIPLLKDILVPIRQDKIFKASFVGSITHPIRAELQNMYGTIYNFSKTDDWKTMIERSTFSLCPRGFGSTSFRLYEAIQLGSIPVYIWDEDLILPFSDVLDWESFSIVIHRSEIAALSRTIDQVDIAAMSIALKRVKGYFTYEYTSKYILQKVRW